MIYFIELFHSWTPTTEFIVTVTDSTFVGGKTQGSQTENSESCVTIQEDSRVWKYITEFVSIHVTTTETEDRGMKNKNRTTTNHTSQNKSKNSAFMLV